jgi:thymidylate kinase
MVAHWFKIKPVLFKNGLVLIDRYYYDYFVDPRRYRLQLSQKLVGVVYKFVPKPDLIFFFDAPAEVLQSRKKEVTFEECARQRAAYLALAKTLPQAVVVDACKPADEVAQDVLQAALNHLGKRAGFPADGVMRGVAE